MSTYEDFTAAGKAVLDAADQAIAQLSADLGVARSEVAILEADLVEARQHALNVGDELAQTVKDLDVTRARVTELEAALAECQAGNGDPEPNPEPVFPMVPSIAMHPKTAENYNALANALGVDENWIYRGYHGGAFKPLTEIDWFNWFKPRFGGLIFSTQHGTTDASYAATARGEHDDMWARIVDSWPDGMPGGLNLGNEMNLESVTASVYRDAIEHLIEKFDLPDNVFWTLAYSNWRSWTAAGLRSPGAQEGSLYLPRTDKRILVLTHTYGKAEWPDVVNQQARFHAEMDKHPTWLRGIGETSAQENPANRDSKANYLIGAAEEMKRHGGSVFSLFDSGTGGSDEIASSAYTAARIAQWSETLDGNRWG